MRWIRRFHHLFLAAVVCGLFVSTAGGFPAAFGIRTAHAGTTSGTGVTVSGLDNLASTIDTYSKGNVGKMLGIGLGIGGMLLMGGGRLGLGGMAATAGVGAAFVPNIIGTAFDATAAAPLVGHAPDGLLLAWWAPALALLYPAMLSLKWFLDPVVWVSLGLIQAASRLRPERQVSLG